MDNVCLCEAPRIRAKFKRTWECTICGKPEQPVTPSSPVSSPSPAGGVREAAIELLSHLKLYVLDRLTDDDALRDRMYELTRALSSPATGEVDDETIKRVADAIDRAEVGYHLRLTRMVDGESTYTLTYQDSGESFEFEDIDDGYAHIRQRKLRAQAEYVIAALNPAPGHGEGGL